MNRSVKTIGLLASLVLAACSSDDDNVASSDGSCLIMRTIDVAAVGDPLCDLDTNPFCAVVNVVAPDYSGADVQIVDGSFVSSGLLPVDQSDYSVSAYGESFYRLGRYEIDAISRYGNDETLTNYYMANGHEGYYTGARANPYDLEFASEDKAFLPLYGSSYVWDVNLNSASENCFSGNKKAVDLSVYSDVDGKPEIVAAKIAGNELFVFMQRLDTTPAYPDPSIKMGSYAAVFDRSDLTLEIETNKGNGFKGIELPAQNPISVAYHSDVGFLVAAVSDYNKTDKQAGIIKINADTYDVSLLVGDETTDGASATVAAAFSAVTIADKDNAFFVAYVGWQDNDVYHLNLLTNAVTKITALSRKNIGVLTTSPDGNVWVGVSDPSDPHIQVIDKTGTFIERHSLMQNPNSIAFMTK